MRIKHYQQAALFSIAASTLSLADPINPLLYSDFSNYSPIHRRELECPADFFSCENQGAVFKGTCCENGQVCSVDAHSSAACCPTTATCTGVAPAGTTTAVSYVSNSYFSFPYIPTSYSNPVACTSAMNACSRNYDACLTQLGGGAGGGYGVTIAVPGGGGTTVAATQPAVASATATSVCSSLSSKACHNLNAAECSQTGTMSGIIVGSGNVAPRPTAACMVGVIAGVGLGLVGGQL